MTDHYRENMYEVISGDEEFYPETNELPGSNSCLFTKSQKL